MIWKAIINTNMSTNTNTIMFMSTCMNMMTKSTAMSTSIPMRMSTTMNTVIHTPTKGKKMITAMSMPAITDLMITNIRTMKKNPITILINRGCGLSEI
jgi:hypothetical protein